MSTATLPDSSQQIMQAVRKVTAIATLPEVTVKIVSTVEDPKSSAAQLHKIIAHDPALVTRILKVVNSSFYGLPGQIASIERAIVLLGLNAVKNIAVAASLGQLFRGVKLCEGFTAKDLWTHCVAVAVSSRELAKKLKIPVADEAFLSGMIHDIGILVSLQTQPEKLQEVCAIVKQTGADFCETERRITGMDHQQLGAALCEVWKFPRSCQQVAGTHHEASAAFPDNRQLVTIVQIADTLCCKTANGFNLTALNQVVDESLAAGIGIEPQVIEQVGMDLPKLLDDASTLFS